MSKSTDAQRSTRRRMAFLTSIARSDSGKTLPVDSTLVSTPSFSIHWTTSAGESWASAECKNLPLRPKADTIPRASVFCVMLHRVPPDIKILTPVLEFFSSSNTLFPRSPADVAANNPAAPAPIMMTSKSKLYFPKQSSFDAFDSNSLVDRSISQV